MGQPRIFGLSHQGERLSDLLIRQQIQKWGLLQLRGKSLPQGVVEDRLAGRVGKIGHDQGLVRQSGRDCPGLSDAKRVDHISRHQHAEHTGNCPPPNPASPAIKLRHSRRPRAGNDGDIFRAAIQCRLEGLRRTNSVAIEEGNIGALRQCDMNWVVPADLQVVVSKAGAKAPSLDPYHWVAARVVVRLAVEYLEANQILLHGVPGSLKGLADDEIQKTAMAGSLAEDGEARILRSSASTSSGVIAGPEDKCSSS